MRYNIFISYAGNDVDIAENLREQFKTHGINAWVYSVDKTLAKDAWKEIKTKIKESDLVVFVVSNNTIKSEGQKKELELTLKKVSSISSTSMMMPLFITGTDPANCPEQLKYKNGLFLDSHTIKSVAQKIASTVFPSQVTDELNKPWKIPKPGEWLEISTIDEIIEEYFNVGDKLYFRALSPMGLFECYAPQIKGLFWIAPDNVKSSKHIENEEDLENQVPAEYRIIGMMEIQRLGWEAWHVRKKSLT